jgi:outer membrane protein assembly factor BamB
LELATGHGKVFLLTSETIECLDAESGERLWRTARPPLPADAVRRLGFAGMYEYLLTVMVYHDGVVLLAQPEPNTHHTYHTMPGTLFAFSADNGEQMWKHTYGGWGHCTPPDVFVVGDNVWTHVNADTEFGSVWGNGYKALDSSKVDYRIQALDLRTGTLRKELPTKDVFNVGHHHRCYRNRVTERFLLSSRRGVEFVDLATGQNYQNHWVRSGCLLGYLPCNGMLYVAPHPCSCYIATKLVGYNALAPARKPGPAIETRLVEGPAYGKTGSHVDATETWPTYRGNGRRTGALDSHIPAQLHVTWQNDIGARPSALVASAGMVFAAGVDTHTVHAFDADTGRALWHYTAGARVDSPPTVHDGLAIFGATDGRVYCLRADDGQLVWRFTAAPQECLVTAHGQLESAWPIPGSVLIHDEKCWFAAGRSSYMDGGIHLYALDPARGKVLHHETIYNPDPATGIATPEPDAHQMAGLLNDIPATDGSSVFIRQMNLTAAKDRSQPRVFSTGGYLDSSWFNRTFWQSGKARTSGLMVLGDGVAYGAEVYASRSRETVFKPGAGAYRLRCVPLKITPAERNANAKRRPREPQPVWERKIGIRVTALLRAADTIFVAGAPDVVDPQDPEGAWEGRQGGILAAFAADDGRKLAQYKLPAPPVWDGMAATPGRLYLATTNGAILSMAAD